MELSPNKVEEKMSVKQECGELLETPQFKCQQSFDSETETVVSTALAVTKSIKKKKKKKKDRSVKDEESSTDVKEEQDKKPIVHGEDEWFESSMLLESVASDGLGEELVKRGWNLVPLERKQKIQEKLRVVEMQNFKYAKIKKELVHDATNAIYEALN